MCSWNEKEGYLCKDEEKTEGREIELVHLDVYGPMSVPFIRGSLYYVTCIDNSTMNI